MRSLVKALTFTTAHPVVVLLLLMVATLAVGAVVTLNVVPLVVAFAVVVPVALVRAVFPVAPIG